MSELCKWQHEQLEALPFTKFRFNPKQLPKNGIYFFYEQNEIWGHGGNKPRIVRVGTHRNGNFRSRIAEHFLFNDSKMNFDKERPKPSDRSIFRKHIGRALLNKREDDYLQMWNNDFTMRKNKTELGNKRDIEKEKKIESEITQILRTNFSFKYIELDNQNERMGKSGLESSLIGTLAQCKLCNPSKVWLGNDSPKKEIRESGLWLVQHLKSQGINENDKKTILDTIERTKTHLHQF